MIKTLIEVEALKGGQKVKYEIHSHVLNSCEVFRVPNSNEIYWSLTDFANKQRVKVISLKELKSQKCD